MRSLLLTLSAVLLVPVVVNARDITDYPICLDIGSRLWRHVPGTYTPNQAWEILQVCMDWQDQEREQTPIAQQRPPGAPGRRFRTHAG